jgi:HEAT repeat protein
MGRFALLVGVALLCGAVAADSPDVAKQLTAQNWEVRRDAAKTIGQRAKDLRQSAFQLGQALRGETEKRVLLPMLEALAEIGPSARLAGADVSSDLVPFLRHTDPDIRFAAIQAAVSVRMPTAYALPELLRLLKDEDVRVRRLAPVALAEGGYPTRALYGPRAWATLPALLEVAQNAKEDLNVRYNTLTAIEYMGPGAKSALPVLLELFKNKENDEFLRGFSLRAAARVAPDDKEFIRWLIELLADKKDFENRAAAAGAIKEMGPVGKEAVPALLNALRAKDVADAKLAAHIQDSVVRALGAIGPEARDAVLDITEILKNSKLDPVRRQVAAWVLGEIGPEAKAAVPALREAVKTSPDPRISDAAKQALNKIER